MRSGGVCYVGGGSFLLVLKGGVRGVRKQALWLAGVFLEAVAWHAPWMLMLMLRGVCYLVRCKKSYGMHGCI